VQIDVLDYNQRKDGQELDMFDFFDNPEDYISAFNRFSRVSDMYIAGHFYGDGVIKSQSINKGIKVKKNQTVVLETS